MPDDHKCLYEDRWGSFGEKLENMHGDIKEIKDLVKEQNGRIRKLESWRSGIVAGIAVIVFVISILLKVIK